MSKQYNPEFGHGGNGPTPPEEQRVTEGMEYILPSTISHEGGLSSSVFRTHIETSGEGGSGVPEFAKDPGPLDETLRRIKEYLRQNPAADDPEGGQFPSKPSVDRVGPYTQQVLGSRPEGPETLLPSWIVRPPQSASPFEPTRRAWEALQDAPAPDENEGSDLYRKWFDDWTGRNAETLGSLGLQEPPEPQERLGDQ